MDNCYKYFGLKKIHLETNIMPMDMKGYSKYHVLACVYF